MAKGRVSGGTGLNMVAKLDINQAKKNAAELIKAFNDINKAATSIGSAAGSANAKTFDTKPLTDYQKEQLVIKQGFLDLAKQKQESAAAEKSASIVLQDALKNERLAREAINTQIARNRLEQQQANAAANKKTPTQFTNSQAEIDAANKAKNGSILYTSAINAETVARAKLNAEAARQAITNGTLLASTTAYTSATQSQTAATNTVVLSKRQLAQMLAEEKLRQAQATAELKNNAREMLNAKGSIEQRKAALVRLTIEYDRLSAAERNTAAGSRLAGIIKGITQQVDELKAATGRGRENLDKYAGSFSQLKAEALSAAAGLLAAKLSFETLKEVASHNAEISDSFTDVQRTAKLSSNEVDDLIKKLKGIDTRTPLEGLLDVGFIGGRLGVAKKDMVGFIQEVDELAVVLKKEFPGGAEAVANSLGKIISVYKITEKQGISLKDAFRKTGSSLLELSHNSYASVQYLQEFALSTAGIAQVVKISMPTMLAYGSVLAKTMSSQTAATGVLRLLSDLSTKREKYFAIAQLGDATLTLEKFTDLINTDAKSALELFFKGLKAGNPTTTEQNDRLKTLALTAGKVKNVVIALSESQDQLFKSTDIANKGFEDGVSSHHNFELANNSLGASFDKLKNKIANIFTSSELARSAGDLLNSLISFKTEGDELTEAYINNKHALDSMETSMRPVIDRYDELQVKGKLSKDEHEELRGIIAKIGEAYPNAVTKINAWGTALDINRLKLQDFNQAQRDLLELQNRDALKKSNDEFDEAQRRLPAARQNYLDQNKNTKSNKVLGTTSLFFTFGKADADEILARSQASKDVITRLSDRAYQAAKNVRDLGGTLTKAQAEILKFYDTPDKKPVQDATILSPEGNEDLDKVMDITAIKKEIKDLTAANVKLSQESDQFKKNVTRIRELKNKLKEAGGGTNSDVTKEENRLKTAYGKAKTLSNEIVELQRSSVRKSKSSDQEELDSVTDKYQKMKDKVIAFYADTENRGAKIQIDGKKYSKDQAIGLLNANSKIESDSVAASQKAKAQLKELDIEKKQYEEYEQYKLEFGEQMANKKYDKLISSHKTYLSHLDDEIKKITDIPEADRTGAQIDQLPELNKRKAEILQADNAKYQELLKQLRTYEQAKIALTDKYNADLAALGESATAAQIKILSDIYAADLDNLKAAESQRAEIYRRLNEQITNNTKAQLKAQIDAIEVALKTGLEMPAKLRKELETKLKDINIKIGLGGGDKAYDKDLKDKKELIESVLNGTAKNIDGTLANAKLTTEEYAKQVDDLAEINKQIAKSTSNKYAKISKELELAADSFNELSASAAEYNSSLANTFLALSQVAKAGADAAKGIAILTDPDSTNFDKIQAGVNGLTSAISAILGAAGRRKKELEDYYRSVIQLQNEYNISLNDQIRLQNTLKESVYLKNYTGRVGDAMKAASDAQAKLNELLPQLANGMAVTGKRDKVDWGATMKSASGGAVFGAAVGSIVPVIGTAIGSIVGGIVGFIGGLFGGKKKVDTLAPLLKEYPELLTKLQDGTISFNAELAKSLVANNLVNDATKTILNNIVDWQKQLEQARAQIKEVVTELSGGLGNDLRDALVQSFKDGTSAAKAFGDSVNKVLENILSNILFNAVFSDALKKLEDDLGTALDPTNTSDKSIVGVLGDFFDKAPGLIDAFNKGLDTAQKEADKRGLDVFRKDGPKASSVGNIQAELTEQTGGKLEGLWRGQFDMTKQLVALSIEHNAMLMPIGKQMADIYQLSSQKLSIQVQIEANTFRTADNTEPLKAMTKQLDQIITNTKPSVTARGAGI